MPAKTQNVAVTLLLTGMIYALALTNAAWAQPALKKSTCPFEDKDRQTLGENLLAMAATGFYQTSQQLLNCGAPINWKDRSNGNTSIHYAALFGHAKVLDLLIQAGAHINEKNEENQTALMLLAQGCHLRGLEKLVPHNPDPNGQDKLGRTALIHSSKSGCSKGVAYLLKLPHIQADHADDFYRTAQDYATERAQLEVGGPYTRILQLLHTHFTERPTPEKKPKPVTTHPLSSNPRLD